MKAVVLGGCGFLGSTIVSLLIEDGVDVVVLDTCQPGVKGLPVAAPWVKGSVLDSDLLNLVLRDADEVYHLAGMLGTSELQESVQSAIATNVIGAVNVFESARRVGVRRVFYPG